MSRIKGRALLAGAGTDLCVAAMFYFVWQSLEIVGFPVGWMLDIVGAAVLLFFIGGSGKLAGFLWWNLGMLVYDAERRRFGRYQAKIEREVTSRIASNCFSPMLMNPEAALCEAEIARLKKELAEAVKGRSQWIQAATPTTALRIPGERGWHGVSFTGEGGWQVWPCSCAACGGSPRTRAGGSPAVPCGIEFSPKPDGTHAYVLIFSRESVSIGPGARLAQGIMHRIDTGVLPPMSDWELSSP